MNVKQIQDAEIGQARLLRMLDCAEGLTIPDMVAATRRDRTTVYRWLRQLQDDGAMVARMGSGRPVKFRRISR